MLRRTPAGCELTGKGDREERKRGEHCMSFWQGKGSAAVLITRMSFWAELSSQEADAVAGARRCQADPGIQDSCPSGASYAVADRAVDS